MVRSFPENGTTSKTETENSEQNSVESERIIEATTEPSKTTRSLINRTNIYKTIERKLNALVFDTNVFNSSR